jgi:uncharacterized coiled-coil protein SlyX
MPRLGDSLPTVTSGIPRDLRNYLDRLRGLLNNIDDTNITTRKSLIELGLLDAGGNVIPTTPTGDYGIPPAVTGLAASAAFQNIILTWDQPAYLGHAFTEIWASPVYDTLLPDTDPGYVNPTTYATFDAETAVIVAITSGSVTNNEIGGARGRYYWARNVNVEGTAGPFNSVTGVLGETAPDVAFLLETLTDSITESQLYADLGARIDLIGALEDYTGYLDGYTGYDLTTRVTTAEGSISSISSSVTVLNNSLTSTNTNVTANASAINALDTRVTSAEGSITSQASLISGIQSSLTTLDGEVSGNATNISQLTTRVTDTEGDVTALSSSLSTLSTTVGNNTTSIQQAASSINGLEAQYTVKIDNNGYVSGFGLASTPVDGTPFSEFIVRADRFAISSVGQVEVVPFIVTTTTTTLNGVSVPAGVYIDQAYIKNGAISNAKIGVAAVDTAQIANAAITNAKINDLDATKINAGFLNAARIEAGSISADKIAANSLTADQIAAGAISASELAISANTDGTANSIFMDANGAIKVYDASGNIRVKLGNLSV